MMFKVRILLLLFSFLISLVAKSSDVFYPVTVVSGYWAISSKHSNGDYSKWMKNAITINAPLIFFYDSDQVKHTIENLRIGYPTKFYKLAINDFIVNKTYNRAWTHHIHIPTAELGMIWLEKLYMLEKSIAWNPYNTTWFAWTDVGNAYYRQTRISPLRWPDPAVLKKLPTNKIIYTDSVTHGDHSFAGTAFLTHQSVHPQLLQRFNESLTKCAEGKVPRLGRHIMQPYECGSDQYIFTIMKADHPQLFHCIGNGYGDAIPLMGVSRFEPSAASALSLAALQDDKKKTNTYAVVTLLPSPATTRAANVLYLSLVANLNVTALQDTVFIAMIPEESSNTINLSLHGWSTISLSSLASTPATQVLAAKLHIWAMTSFRRVLFVDPHSLCTGDVSAMLTRPTLPLAAMRGRGHFKDGRVHYSADVFSVRPNATEYDRLRSLLIPAHSNTSSPSQAASGDFLGIAYPKYSAVDSFSGPFGIRLSAAPAKAVWTHLPQVRVIQYSPVDPATEGALALCNKSHTCEKVVSIWHNWDKCLPT